MLPLHHPGCGYHTQQILISHHPTTIIRLTYIRSMGQGDTPSSSTVTGGPSESSSRGGIAPVSLGTTDGAIGNFEVLQSTHAIIDDRLNGVNFQRWTSVPITNELAATLISLYLEIDHPWCPLFDADLFLNDCAHGSTHFCSTLLVNALLAWACVSYSRDRMDVLSGVDC